MSCKRLDCVLNIYPSSKIHFQDVETSPTRIIRECAYTGDKHMDGMRKQGNKAVKLTYYQCENTDNV